MPWSVSDVSGKTKKAKTAAQKRQWRDIANAELAKHGDESRAIRAADAVIADPEAQSEEAEMTVVVYRDGVMAGDTGAWDHDILVSVERQKVFRTPDGGLLGMAGEDCDMQAFLQWWCSDGIRQRGTGGRWDARPTLGDEPSLSAITVRPDGEVLVWNDRIESFVEQADWTAIGCHNEFIHGVLAAGLTAEETVELALRRCAFAAGEIVTARLDDRLPPTRRRGRLSPQP